MKTFLLFLGLILVFFSCSNSRGGEDLNTHEIIDDFINQYIEFLEIHLNQDLKTETQIRNGYFAGFNWNMFFLSGKEEFESIAKESLEVLENDLVNSPVYPAGKHLLTSFGKGFKVTNKDCYQKVLIQAANDLSVKFNQKTGRFDGEKQDIITIESAMNLELLFWIARVTGEPVYYNIASRHGETLISSCLDTNYSSQFDSQKVKPLIINCCVLLYKETGESEYLQIAEKSVLEVFQKLNSVDSQKITDQKIDESGYDAASLAILASALYELSQFSGKNKYWYTDIANKIIDMLSAKSYFDYENSPNTVPNMKNAEDFNKEPVWSDVFFAKEFFFLEALVKKRRKAIT
jgi:unsaturated chondroitin disaccharide hydrolase